MPTVNSVVIQMGVGGSKRIVKSPQARWIPREMLEDPEITEDPPHLKPDT